MNFKKIYSNIRYWIINIEVGIIVLLGLGNIILCLPRRLRMIMIFERGYSFFSPNIIALHRTASTIIGLILIFISYRLYKRIKTAWVITMCLMPVSFFIHIVEFNGHLRGISIIELITMAALIFTRRDFKRNADPIKLKWGIMIAVVSFLIVLMNSAFGMYMMRGHFRDIDSFSDAFYKSLQLLYFMDLSHVAARNRSALLFARSSIVLNWACLISALILVLKPLVYEPIVSNYDKEKARQFLKKYGQNPIDYVDMENDKKYFFGSESQGFIAYIVVGGVAVCSGDPVCSEDDIIMLISEFITFCKQNELAICFCQVMPYTLKYFKEMKFGTAKYGEEAMFDLETYTIKGSKAAKIRQSLNHAVKMGISVFEYKPKAIRNSSIEEQIMSVSNEWLEMKKSSELSFMLGSVSLENPMDRRYFVAVDKENNVQGFIVFVPFLGGKGYYADVTRRRIDAPPGVMESITINAFDAMKKEGVKYGSLGLAPLYNVENNNETKNKVDNLLNYVYEHMNGFYGFKTLYQYKKKYAPTDWNPRYLVYYPNVFTPKIAYSIVAAQNSRGVKDYLLNRVRNRIAKKFD